MTRDEDKHWHLDRKVPIAMIFAIFMQTVAAVWFVSGLSTRVTNIETRLEATAPQADRITRVEIRVEGVQSDVSEIKSDVKRLLTK